MTDEVPTVPPSLRDRADIAILNAERYITHFREEYWKYLLDNSVAAKKRTRSGQDMSDMRPGKFQKEGAFNIHRSKKQRRVSKQQKRGSRKQL